MVEDRRCWSCWRLNGGGGVDWAFWAFDCLLSGVREGLGLGFGEDDFVGVRVDAALRFEKEVLVMRDALSGVEGAEPPMRRFAMDAVKD
jgi:hypothetical protein